MDLKIAILTYLPLWLFAAIFLYFVSQSSHKYLLQFHKTPFFKFLRVLTIALLIKLGYFYFFGDPLLHKYLKDIADFIPLPIVLGVFWEDVTTSLPLVLLEKYYANKSWFKYLKWPLLFMTMVGFGSGHLYQGAYMAMILSLYVPLGMAIGKKYGFGTLMACHILYDFLTLLLMRLVSIL